jgi:hypothetical protein
MKNQYFGDVNDYREEKHQVACQL